VRKQRQIQGIRASVWIARHGRESMERGAPLHPTPDCVGWNNLRRMLTYGQGDGKFPTAKKQLIHG
jgi:hypothetical protein